VDNADADCQFTSGWTVSTDWSGYFREDALWIDKGTGSETAHFTFHVPNAGKYSLYEWHPSVYSGVADAQLTVSHAKGNTPIFVRQNAYPSQWNFLGLYPFARGRYTMTLSNKAGTLGTTVVADALKLVVYRLTGDLNGDHTVNERDLLLLIKAFHTKDAIADIDEDGTVDDRDIWLLIQNWSVAR